VLPCGPMPPNPAELMHAERFRALLAELSRRFDRILFDSPPVAAVADAMILASEVDGVLLLAKAGKTTKDDVAQARRALSDVQARVVGTLLNAVDLERPRLLPQVCRVLRRREGVNLLLSLLPRRERAGRRRSALGPRRSLSRSGTASLRSCTRPGADLPPAARERLREARIAALRDWIAAGAEPRSRAEAAPGRGGAEGVSYARILYKMPELRPCADVDLLHPGAEMPGHERTYNRRGWSGHRPAPRLQSSPSVTVLDANSLFARAVTGTSTPTMPSSPTA